MKKFARILVAMVLVVGLVMPVQASRLPAQEVNVPESFYFTADFTMSGDFFSDAGLSLAMMLVFGGSDIGATITGSVVNDGETAVQKFSELRLNSGVFGRAPIRTWMDMDVSDIDDPTLQIILELPQILRLFLSMQNRTFGRQFLVLDLSEIVAEQLTDTVPTPDELQTIIDEALAELSNRNILVRFAQFTNLLNFALDFSPSEGNNTEVSLDFDVVLDRNGTPVEVNFEMDMEITNINNATVDFPRLTTVNSANVLELVSR